MLDVDPGELALLLQRELPPPFWTHAYLAGSVAAALYLRRYLQNRSFRTKDADIVVQPIAETTLLADTARTPLASGWTYHDKASEFLLRRKGGGDLCSTSRGRP